MTCHCDHHDPASSTHHVILSPVVGLQDVEAVAAAKAVASSDSSDPQVEARLDSLPAKLRGMKEVCVCGGGA